jgi:hypothetical protein
VKGEDAGDKQARRVEILNRLLATLADATREHRAAREPPLDPGEIRVPAPRHLRLVRPRPALGALTRSTGPAPSHSRTHRPVYRLMRLRVPEE